MNFFEFYERQKRLTKDEDYWETAYGGIDNYFKLSCHEAIVFWLSTVFDFNHKRVLDIGGGPGLHAYMLKEIIPLNVTNIDKSPLACFISRKQGVRTYWHDITKFPWPCGKVYDIIYSIQVLEHFTEEQNFELALYLYDLLNSYGKLFLSVASPDNISDPDHKTLKPVSWWLDLYKTAGFVEFKVSRRVINTIPMKDWQCLFLQINKKKVFRYG